MPSQSDSPPVARCLIVATLFAFGFLATVSLSLGYAAGSPQGTNSPAEAEIKPRGLVHQKRLLGLGGVLGIVPSILGNLASGGIASSLASQVTADINSLLPMINGPSGQSSNAVTLTKSGQATLPLTAQPMSTGAQLSGLADKLGSLLSDAVPVAAPSIIAVITKQAYGVVNSVEAIATEVVSLGNQIDSHHIQAPDALDRIGDIFGSLDSKVKKIVNDVTSNLASDFPSPILQDLSQVISSGLGDIVGAANGPVSLVGDIIEKNVCGVVTTVDGILVTVADLCGNIPSAVAQISSEIATASLTNPDVTLTDYAFSSVITSTFSSIGTGPTLSALSTSIPQGPNLTSSKVPPEESNTSQTITTGANGIITVTEYQILTQQCTSSVAQFKAMIGQTVTETASGTCPTSSCPPISQATCHCPNANPTSPGSNGAQGPCPETGYTCDDCLDGWFCPPSQTPAQSAPCGFGWPCAHCEGGWFCAPHLTPGPCTGSGAPAASPHNTVAMTHTKSSPTPRGSAPSRPSPPPPEIVTGWSYCGCWADQVDQRALDAETFSLDLLTNEACIQHCLIRGFVMAGTENGNSCLCGNFLNGTQMMDEGVCSIPCSGDATQKCGGLNALSCYSPDGQPYGWASAGPQPRAPTIQPPKVLALDIGGVAHTKITTPAVIFPPRNVDPNEITSLYGKVVSQPLGDLPSGITLSSPPISPSTSTPANGAGGVAPGRGTLPTISSSSSSSGASDPFDSLTSSSGNSGTSNVPGTSSTPGTSNSPDTSGSPGTLGIPSTSVVASTTSTSTISGSISSSTGPNGNGGAAPGQGTRPTSATSGEHSSTTSTAVIPTSSSVNPAPSISSGTSTTSPSNPSENTSDTSVTSSSTPSGAGGVAPGHGQGPSTTSGDQNSSSVPSASSAASPSTTPTGGPSTGIVSSESVSPGQGPEQLSTTMHSGSESCKGAGCTSTGGTNNPSQRPSLTSPDGGTTDVSMGPSVTDRDSGTAPGQTHPSMSSSGVVSPPSSTSLSGSGSATDNPSSSSPISGGAVAPGQGQQSPSSSSSGGSITCLSGSSGASCIPSSPSGSKTPVPSQNSGSTSSTNPSSCPSGSNDPACTSPFGGGGVAPVHGQPSTLTPSSIPSTLISTPSNIPSTCASDSTDPSCTSPISGGAVAPGQNQPTNPSSPGSPTSQTTQPSVPSSGSSCTPGSTDPKCSLSNSSGSSGPSGIISPATSPLPSSKTSDSSVDSTPSSNSGSSVSSGQGPVAFSTTNGSLGPTTTSPGLSAPSESRSSNQITQSNPSSMPSSPSQGSTSTPNGAGGVAPGQQSPGSQLTPSGSSTGSLVTTSDESQTFGPTHPSEGNGRSITSTGTGSSPLSSSGGISPLNTPGQPTPSSPDQGGGVGPHPASSSPQTSYTFAPGVVPYGATSPSMTTLASMLAWREPDGERGSPAMLRPAGMYDHPNLQQDVPVLNFEEAPTTATTFSKSADPRWQRIRPVYVW